MENPEPVREHRELEKLVGHFAGAERMHPSYFNADAKRGEATTDAHVALDGFAVVQDYEQQLEDGSHFAGHGVFRYDMPSNTYEMHWFDSTGGPVRIFRGGFADRMLVLTGRAGDGWQRLTYDFNLAGGYRFKLETSDDGNTWYVALEGDNLQEKMTAPQAGTQRGVSRKAAGARRKTVARKTSGRKAGARKATTKKATARKASAGKATAKKAGAKKAGAKKAGAKKVARRTAGRKASAKRTPARKASTRKAVTKKPAARKVATKKAATKTSSAAKAPAKKRAAKKATAKKATAKRSPARKAGATTQVASVERRRRKGKTSRALATSKATARGNGSAVSRRSISQKKTKSSAQEAPRMPTLKKTSTRTGWHRTVAKGVRG